MLYNSSIRGLIPHRYPFLMVDRVLEMEPGKKCTAIKNVTANEPFFQGHFPDRPIMPGVLMLEALAQTAGLAIASMPENKGKLGVFTGIDGVKIRRQVVPGDTLKLEAEIVLFKRGMAKASVRASVEDETAVQGEVRFVMVDADSE